MINKASKIYSMDRVDDMKDKLQNFMVGRYGADSFSKFLLILSMISIGISLLLGRLFLVIAILLLSYNYYRMFSKDYEKRYKENMKYKDILFRVTAKIRSWKNTVAQRKTHHIYKCPGCKQKIRIHKGRGTIMVTCPKCKTEFKKKS